MLTSNFEWFLLATFFIAVVDSFFKTNVYNQYNHIKSKHINQFTRYGYVIDYTGNDDIEPYMQFKILSFNILAPCYSKIKNSKVYESELKDKYLHRNNEICDQLIQSNADIIFLQEFWTENQDLRELYQSRLGTHYEMKELPRTRHWRTREDGLAMFLNKKRLKILDVQDIRFHDCGDRVAQLLLLAIKPEEEEVDTSTTTTEGTPSTTASASTTYNANNSSTNSTTIPSSSSSSSSSSSFSSLSTSANRYQQFLCVNTHLLFPHNEASTNIRLREMSKILDFVESYRQNELCDKAFCKRSDIRLPG